jgi:uncharacterized protein YcbK (DUF882 family)
MERSHHLASPDRGRPRGLRLIVGATIVALSLGAVVAVAKPRARVAMVASLPSPLPPPAEVVADAVDDARVTVELHDVHTGRSARFELPLDGRLPRDEARALARFLACRRTGKVKRLKPGVIAMLAGLGQRYPGHVIEIISGYRGSRKERRTSPHLAGRAIDLRVRGVDLREVRDWLWATHRKVGIGYYPHQKFLHMDVRAEDVAWTQPRYNADNDYHPRWARRARRAARAAR